MMYSLDQVRSAIRDPKLVIELLNRKIWHYKSGVPYNANGINILVVSQSPLEFSSN